MYSKVCTSQKVKFCWGNNFLREEVSHDFNAIIASVNVVPCKDIET